ncbi:aftiphilin [Arctopsyche grandis]|uniref:aftiphilin n=1 Tax=Arctopsyche grandis TaxID=121162 RepID=UPI00406D8F8C
MSVPPPPLVSSTPPPPDHCDDDLDLDEDEFTFQCTDSSHSPSNQFEPERFSFDCTYVEKVSSESVDANPSQVLSKEKVNTPSDENAPTLMIQNESQQKEPFPKFIESLQVNRDGAKNDSEEENNIEDLDLKLDSLQIDFQNGKESVEDSLNASFDDFGTFFSSSTLNSSPETSYYLPKVNEGQTPDAFEKDSRSHETSSDVSVSIPNEENSDVDVALEIPHDSPQNEPDDIVNSEIKSDESLPIEDIFLDIVEKYNRVEVEEAISSEIPTTDLFTVCGNCSERNCVCSIENTHSTDIITDDFVVDWNQNASNHIPESESTNQITNLDLNFGDDLNSGNELSEQKSNETDSDLDLGVLAEKKDDLNDDDFGDFEDFTTFQSGDIKDILSGSLNTSQCPPPLETANIDDVQCDVNEKMDFIVDNNSPVNDFSSTPPVNDVDDDDDFGDFDTYNPVVRNDETAVSETTTTDDDDFKMSELLSENESTAGDKFNLVVNNIFCEENVFECDIESKESNCELKTVLGESWNHLINCETEQSYLFPWNNSASQKSLLKSLGIDSRNILFGPKWNVNMPRFAANLGSNPLQPIKPISEQYSERKLTNVGDAQSSPALPGKDFGWENGSSLTSADLQASCSERDDLSNVVHAFEAQTPSEEPKTDKPSHPTVLNFGRKINLPDTHIFTPTDSETPWSHTIHYNDENFNSFQDPPSNDFKTSDVDKIVVTHNESFDEFDDFQSHKTGDIVSTGDNVYADIKEDAFKVDSLSTIAAVDKGNAILNVPVKDEPDDFGDFQSAEAIAASTRTHFTNTNLLEPVKLSPMAPIVNWPAPGEVKSSDFNDFSDLNDISLPVSTTNVNTLDNGFMDALSDLSSLPNLPLGSTQFILKESKIVSDANVADSVEPVQMQPNEKHTRINQSDFSVDFTEFSTNSITTKESISNVSNINILPTNNGSNVDDFDDFQSVKFVPFPNNVPNKEIALQPSLTIFENGPSKAKNDMRPVVNYSLNSYEKPPLEPTYARRQTEEYSSKSSSQQILQPLSLENYSQINWPNPGIDFQDLARFNPVDSIKSYSEVKENTKASNSSSVDPSNDDEGWSDFVSTKPVASQHSSTKPTMPNMLSCNGFGIANSSNPSMDDSVDWSDFVSSTVPSKNTNELKTISQNIHSQSTVNNPSYSYKNSNLPTAKSKTAIQSSMPPNVNILPNLTYVSSKTNTNRNYSNHFQNL